jgi:hypothetical protein
MIDAHRRFLVSASAAILLSASAMAGLPPPCPPPPPPPLSGPAITYVGSISGCSNQVGGNPFCVAGEVIQFKYVDGISSCSATYHWDFQDGIVLGGATVTHAFGAPGAFNVDLGITYLSSGTFQVSQVVNVNGSVPTLGAWALLALATCLCTIAASRLR